MTETEQSAPETIDGYIAEFPENIQKILESIRTTIREAVPDAKEAIKYRMPTFTLNGNLVHFAAFRNHIGFYPAPQGIDEFQDELSRYAGAKGSVRFPLTEPVPLDLIRRIAQFRAERNREKGAGKGKRK